MESVIQVEIQQENQHYRVDQERPTQFFTHVIVESSTGISKFIQDHSKKISGLNIGVGIDIDGVFNYFGIPSPSSQHLQHELALEFSSQALNQTIFDLEKYLSAQTIFIATSRLREYELAETAKLPFRAALINTLFIATARALGRLPMYNWREVAIKSLCTQNVNTLNLDNHAFSLAPSELRRYFDFLISLDPSTPYHFMWTNCGKSRAARQLDLAYNARQRHELDIETFPDALNATIAFRDVQVFIYIDSGRQSEYEMRALTQRINFEPEKIITNVQASLAQAGLASREIPTLHQNFHVIYLSVDPKRFAKL